MEFPWDQLGVNMALVGAIVGLVQLFKQTIGQNLPGLVFIVVAMVLSALVAFVQVESGSHVVVYIQAVISWAAAAVFTYDVAEQTKKYVYGKRGIK